MSKPRYNPPMTLPELLAPAGDWTALKAAAANGADAVYFGVVGSNARARAANFAADELPRVMDYLHRRNVLGFVALNTLAFPDELPGLAELVARIAAAGVDAVIVQDLGLVQLCKRVAPTLPVHASTQMTLTEARGVNFVTGLGVERAVLARELSVADIKKVVASTPTPVEVFIHGALCVAYSGQCLTSEALGGRSANRGQCAQACRLPYEMVVDGVQKPLGDKAYLLSPQDLAAHAHIAELVEAGVASFKIEGRLKGGPYVAATTQTYRKAIDAAVARTPFALDSAQQRDLAQVFSRGLTPGFLAGLNHQTLVRGRVPKSRGVRLGAVTRTSAKSVRVTLTPGLPADSVRPGDGVLFDLGRPETDEPGGRVWAVRAVRDEIELDFDRASDFSRLPLGCEVWKTDDPALKKRLEQSYATDTTFKRPPVAATLAGDIGGPLTLTLRAPSGLSASAAWPGPLELATRHAATPESIRTQVDRLGDTPFALGEFIWRVADGAMVPKSVLNDLRRRAADDLTGRVLAAARHAVAEPDALTKMRAAVPRPAAGVGRLTVLVRDAEQLAAALNWTPPAGVPGLAGVTCDFEDARRYADAVRAARAAGIRIALAPPRVWKPGEDGFQSLVVRAGPDGVLVRNLAGLGYFREKLPGAELVGDFSLNVANDLTARILLDAGLTRFVPSFDLNWEQFESLLGRVPGELCEPVIHQHMPMFHTEHCVFAAELSGGTDHTNCGRPCDRHKVELRDRTGAAFPVVADAGCRNTVFNSVAQSAAEYVSRMRALGVRRFRVDLLRETPGEARELLDRYGRVAAGLDDGRAAWRGLHALNQLGVTRGTLSLA